MAQDSKTSENTQVNKYNEAVKKAAELDLAKVAIGHATEVEVERVTTLAKTTAVKAMSKIEELSKKIKEESKPDNVSFIMNGAEDTKVESFSAAKYATLQKLRESYKKLTEAFEKAMETGKLADFESLVKVLDSTK